MSNYVFYDIEVFKNFFCVELQVVTPANELVECREYMSVRFTVGDKVKIVSQRAAAKQCFERLYNEGSIFVGYNSFQYDNIILMQWLLGDDDPAKLYELSLQLINNPNKFDRPERRFTNKDIDIHQLIDGRMSLKLMEAKMNMPSIKECSTEWDEEVRSKSEIDEIRRYCEYDVEATRRLFFYEPVQKQYIVKSNLVKQYEIDKPASMPLPFLSGIILSKLMKGCRRSKCDVIKEFSGEDIILDKLKNADFSPKFRRAVDKILSWRFNERSKRFELKIDCGSFGLKMGVGGLHNTDIESYIFTNLKKGERLIDLDVTSYYPSMILNYNIYPEQLGPDFLSEFRKLVERRIKAKREGRKSQADCEKILINSVFGKFNSKNSFLYSPRCFYSVTLNCQIFLLLLVDKLSQANIPILQVNTDGVLVKINSPEEFNVIKQIKEEWCKFSGLNLEETEYKKLVMTTTNNYMALKTNGSVKEKGYPFVSSPALYGGGTYPLIIPKSIREYFFNGVPVDETIEAAFQARRWEDFVMYARRYKFTSPPGCQKKVNRYYYVKNGFTLKSMSEKGHEKTDCENIALFNEYTDNIWDDLYLKRYIRKAKDEIHYIKYGRKSKPPQEGQGLLWEV